MQEVEVLLVDDEEEYVRALAERLELRGFNTRVVLSGEQCLRIVSERVPGVILLDLKMPGMDGLEVLRRIRKDHAKLPVVIVTAHGSEKDRETARELGAFEQLQKPVQIEYLVQIVREAVRQAAFLCEA